jgi:hypothetical protein
MGRRGTRFTRSYLPKDLPKVESTMRRHGSAGARDANALAMSLRVAE